MYEPEVDDYVIWEKETWCGITTDQGWVYFKAPETEEKKGFSKHPRYITIETHCYDKPKEPEECRTKNPHRKIHCLLLCYESDWCNLKFIKRRETKHCQHYSQYDDVTGNEDS